MKPTFLKMHANLADGGESGGTGDGSTNVDPAIIAEAKAMGWVDQDKWVGKTPWVPADKFVETGRTKLPVLNARVQALAEQNRKLTEQLRESHEDVKTIAETSYRIAQAEFNDRLAELQAKRVTAVNDGDGAAMLQAEQELAELQAQAPVKPKILETQTPVSTIPANQTTPPEIQAWLDENPWYEDGSDAQDIAQAQALVIARRSAREGKPLIGRALADAVKDYMVEHHPDLIGEAPPSGHESGRPRQQTRSTSTAKTYENLPADAKATCDRYIQRGLIGKDPATGKQTAESIARARKAYAATYEWDE